MDINPKTSINLTKENNLLDPEITVAELVATINGLPEARAAAKVEAEEASVEQRSSKKEAMLGENIELVIDSKLSRGKKRHRPGTSQLRESFHCIARRNILQDGLCEVFSNGYAIYDNGNRKTVLWVPDCLSTTYYFEKLNDSERGSLKEKDEIGEELMGTYPWYIALTIAGENSIERNIDYAKSGDSISDADVSEIGTYESYRWVCGARFDTPEEAYLTNRCNDIEIL